LGNKPEAREPLLLARATFEDLGTPRWLAEVDDWPERATATSS
jgi:hypothetical protein